ncbi:MAG: hypothetical protein ACRDTX_17700 [Pseudonocardiaceae bacterium]
MTHPARWWALSPLDHQVQGQPRFTELASGGPGLRRVFAAAALGRGFGSLPGG